MGTSRADKGGRELDGNASAALCEAAWRFAWCQAGRAVTAQRWRGGWFSFECAGGAPPPASLSERPNPHSARTWGRLGGDPRLDDVERTLRREKAATRQRAGVHRYVCGAVLADARVAACAKGLCAQMPTSRGYENTLPWRGASAQRPGLAASESIRRDAPAATMCAGSGRRIQDANSPCALRSLYTS